MSSNKKFVKIIILFIYITFVGAQNNIGRVGGYLKDAATGEPVMYANVVLEGTDIGTASDNYGYYVITNIPVGEHNLKIMMMGYKTEFLRINILDNDDQRHDFELSTVVITGEEVTVTAERQRFEEKVEVSRVNLGLREIKNTPAFVEADLFRTLQLLPGVTSTNDFSSALIVRGGSTDENLILLDGIELYNPYHLGGVFSTFNANAISDAEFIAGGFSANFGNRVSSVLQITSKEGNSKNGKYFSGKDFGRYWDLSQVQGEVSLLSSKILAEGPLYKGSWMWSYRRTYFDKLAGLYYRIKPNTSDVDWKYFFWDTQGKLIHNISPKNRLTFSTYLGRDVLSLNLGDTNDKINFDWDWGNFTNSLQWRYVPNSRFLSTFSIANTDFQFDVNLNLSEQDSIGNSQTNQIIVFNEITDWTVKEKIDWFISNKNTLTTGFEYKQLGMQFKFGIDDITYFNHSQKPSILSYYLQDRWQIVHSLTLQTGLRISKYELHNKYYLEPRFGFKYLLNENLALKGAWGKYKQFLFTTNDDNAVLNIVEFWQPIPKNYKAKSLQQYILGIEQWLGNGYYVSLESYYKPYGNVLSNNPNNNPIDENDDYIEGTAKVYGVEFLLRKNTGKLTGWLGYSYIYNRQQFDFNSDGKITEELGEVFAPYSDQPHTLNIVANYTLNKKNNFGLTLSNSSGRPYTPTVGYTYTQNLSTGQGGNDTYNNPYGNLIELTGLKNSVRYPMYLRVDISWIHKISPFGWNGNFKFQIINVTNYFNTLLYEWDLEDKTVTAVGMFPFFPSIGIEFKF
ncbi:MAG: TonB-dependent receptor [Planctomycetia bacterium]|nr:TonB-dependent receptor [Planctomycetia bacterium]